jgi:tetratricopeptide (TPR) repeat protein
MEDIKSEKEQLTALEDLFQQKRFSDALDTALKLKEDYPKSFQIRFLHVRILEELNKAGEAETALIELMQMFPNNINLLLEIGKLCTEQNKVADALEYYNKILFLDPFNSEAKAAIDKINIVKKNGSGNVKGNTAIKSYPSDKLHDADTLPEVDQKAWDLLTREPQTPKPDILSPPAPPIPAPPPPPIPEEEMGIPEEELEEEEEELDEEKTSISQPIISLEQYMQLEQPEPESPSPPPPIEFKIEEIAEFPEEEPPTIPPIPEVEEAEISESLFDSKDGETPEPSEILEDLESPESQEPPQPPDPPEPPFEFKMEENVQMMEAETDVDTYTEADVDMGEETDGGEDIEIPEAGKLELEAIGVEEAELKHEEPGANEDITVVTEFMAAETETETETETGIEAESDADIVTESAAELYLKQGLVNDALVIYKKLYESQKEERFLIKINQLKSQQVNRGKILILTEFLKLIRQKQRQ